MAVKEIYPKGRVFQIETRYETYFVPGPLVGGFDDVPVGQPIRDDEVDHDLFVKLVEKVSQYVPAPPSAIDEITVIIGYVGRWTMPGYLDAGEWLFAETRKELEEYLDG